MRPDRVGLEHHADPALVGRHERFPCRHRRAGGRSASPSPRPGASRPAMQRSKCRFPAAARAEERGEGAVRAVDGDVAERRHRRAVVRFSLIRDILSMVTSRPEGERSAATDHIMNIAIQHPSPRFRSRGRLAHALHADMPKNWTPSGRVTGGAGVRITTRGAGFGIGRSSPHPAENIVQNPEISCQIRAHPSAS